MRQGGNLVRAARRLAHGHDGGCIVLPEQQHRANLFRRRQDLDRDLRQRRQGAETARHQFAEVVAGDVLDHPAAGFEGLAPAGNTFDAKKMIPRSARLDPAWPSHIGGQHAADGLVQIGLVQIAEIRRLECQLLPLLRQHGLDLAQGRRGARAQNKLFGLV